MKNLLLTLPLLFGALLLSPTVQAAELQLPTHLAGPSFDLDLGNHQAADEDLSIEERRAIQARLKKRRQMVPIHQTFAFAAAGLIFAAEGLGIANDIALAKGSPKRAELEGSLLAHRILAGAATTAYLGAGIIAWTMPPARALQPSPAAAAAMKGKFDSGEAHVILSIVHGIAMGTVMATGILQANVAPASAGWDALVSVHKVAGITAGAAVLAAGITIGTL